MPTLTPTIKFLARHWPVPAMLVLLLVSWLHGYHTGDTHRERVWAARWSAHAAQDATAVAEAATAARQQERLWVAAFDVSAGLYQEQVDEIQKHRDRLLADLRAGRLRLPTTPAGLPSAAAHPADAGAGQEAGQSDLVAERITERFAACDEAVIERNLALELLRAERSKSP